MPRPAPGSRAVEPAGNSSRDAILDQNLDGAHAVAPADLLALRAAAGLEAAAERLLDEAEHDLAAAEQRRSGRLGPPTTALPDWVKKVADTEASARAALRGPAEPVADREAEARAELEEIKKRL